MPGVIPHGRPPGVAGTARAAADRRRDQRRHPETSPLHGESPGEPRAPARVARPCRALSRRKSAVPSNAGSSAADSPACSALSAAGGSSWRSPARAAASAPFRLSAQPPRASPRVRDRRRPSTASDRVQTRGTKAPGTADWDTVRADAAKSHRGAERRSRPRPRTPGRRGHVAHEPRISRSMAEDVPSTGLPVPSMTGAYRRSPAVAADGHHGFRTANTAIADPIAMEMGRCSNMITCSGGTEHRARRFFGHRLVSCHATGTSGSSRPPRLSVSAPAAAAPEFRPGVCSRLTNGSSAGFDGRRVSMQSGRCRKGCWNVGRREMCFGCWAPQAMFHAGFFVSWAHACGHRTAPSR